MAELVYPELSYKLMGLLFEVQNRLGGNFEEKYYQKAGESLFKKVGYYFNASDLADEIPRVMKELIVE